MFTLFAMLKGWSTTYECWPAKGKVWDKRYSDKTPVGWWTEEGYSRIEIESIGDTFGLHEALDSMTKEQYYEFKRSMRELDKKMSLRYKKEPSDRNLFLDFLL